MPVEFHCEHCNKHVKAPSEAAGRKGKCPHCGGVCYIPMPADEIEELPLAPLDESDERRRQREMKEAADLQHRLLRERVAPGETGPSARGAGNTARSSSPSRERDAAYPGMAASDVEQLVVAFVEAMSGGQLERADRVALRLANDRDQVMKLVEKLSSGERAALSMPDLPKPVLIGFLKQLRAKLG